MESFEMRKLCCMIHELIRVLKFILLKDFFFVNIPTDATYLHIYMIW